MTREEIINLLVESLDKTYTDTCTVVYVDTDKSHVNEDDNTQFIAVVGGEAEDGECTGFKQIITDVITYCGIISGVDNIRLREIGGLPDGSKQEAYIVFPYSGDVDENEETNAEE